MTRAVVFLLRCYQVFLSPLFAGCCRYEPSCSAYWIEALQRHGLLRGLAMGSRRLLRCHPLAAGGFDPVPERVPAQGEPHTGDAP